MPDIEGVPDVINETVVPAKGKFTQIQMNGVPIFVWQTGTWNPGWGSFDGTQTSLAVGKDANLGLSPNTTAVGFGAAKNATGQGFTAVGENAAGAASGVDVIAVGPGAASDATGSSLTAIGSNAAQHSAATESVIIGRDAGANNGGKGQVVIGPRAGQNVTESRSVLIGFEAGHFTATGPGAVGIGSRALADADGRADVVAVGTNAGVALTGTSIVAVGAGTQPLSADPVSKKTMTSADVNVAAGTFTVTGHGYGNPGDRVKVMLIPSVGGIGPAPYSVADKGAVAEVEVVDADTLRAVNGVLSVGSGAFTVYKAAANMLRDVIAVGYSAYATADRTAQLFQPEMTGAVLRVGDRRMISVQELQQMVAASTDWAAFKSSVANLAG